MTQVGVGKVGVTRMRHRQRDASKSNRGENTTLRETEANLATWLEDLLHRFHWTVAHFRPAQLADGSWRTAVSCDGQGFPDYICVGTELRESNRRHLVIELKSETGRISLEQAIWLDLFNQVEGTEVYLIRPSDRDEFQEIILSGHTPNLLERAMLKCAWVNRMRELPVKEKV